MTRAAGALLFLPVPIVLLLFTWLPLGVFASLALGVALMATHRLYARPWALARADSRCLWCGGAAGSGPALALREPLGETRWRACGAAHAEHLARVLGWAARRASFLRAGILGTLLLFLVACALAGLGRLGPLTTGDAVAFFRIGIAVSVLPLGLLGPLAPPAPEPLSPPFPVHIQALIGTWAVLWLFRLIGLAWLALGGAHLLSRL